MAFVHIEKEIEQKMNGNRKVELDPVVVERNEISRRLMIRDVCAATGWVFLTGAALAREGEPAIVGDEKNNDKAWGTVRGRLVLDGSVPARKEAELEKANLSASDLKWFKSMGPILNEDWVVDPKTKGIQWVYVWLLPEDPKGSIQSHPSLLELPKEKRLVIVDQEPVGYVPHSVGIRSGQGLLMRNKGSVAHVFNLTGFKNEPFNKAMPPGSEIAVENLKPESTPIQINCPPHPWERMWLRVFDHPYFAVTDEIGNFEIKLAPSGKCRLVVWHESAGFAGGRAGKNGSMISVEGAAITDVGVIKLSPKI